MTALPRVLVTGFTGFVGAAVTLELIQTGYKVKGTTRRKDKADAFLAKYPAARSHLEYCVIKDMTEPRAFNTALGDVDYVIHIASPFSWKVEDKERDMLIPAVEGTRNLLQAATKRPRIKHVVVTSSFAANLDLSKGSAEVHTYADDSWNPATREDAISSDSGHFLYMASKKLAEKAAWEFLEREQPHFTITTFCPPYIFGPTYQAFASMDALNESAAEIWSIIGRNPRELPPTLFPVFIDVRDVAQLHVEALSNPKARNQRYLIVGGHFSNAQIVHIIAKTFPDRSSRLSTCANLPPPPHYATDCTKVERDFGIRWTPLEKCIVDMAKVLYAREEELSRERESVRAGMKVRCGTSRPIQAREGSWWSCWRSRPQEVVFAVSRMLFNSHTST